jgi:hypothetical protein
MSVLRKYCPSLPSSEAAAQVIAGDLYAVPAAVGSTLMRAGLIATGIGIAGLAMGKKSENLVRDSIAGAVVVEVFVLGWIYMKSRKVEA